MEGVAVSMEEVKRETKTDQELKRVMQHLQGSRNHKDWQDYKALFRQRADL